MTGPDASACEKMYAALKVITETGETRKYLRLADPKALSQALVAVSEYESATEKSVYVPWPLDD